MSDDILARAAKDFVRQIDTSMERALFGQTTNAAPEEPAILDVSKMVHQWDQAIRNMRRESVTFVVDLAHQGNAIKHETPNDGARIELSYVQANEVHKHWPLRLSKALSEHCAEFVPVSGVFPEIVPKRLPAPPYDILEDEAFDDWMNGQ